MSRPHNDDGPHEAKNAFFQEQYALLDKPHKTVKRKHSECHDEVPRRSDLDTSHKTPLMKKARQTVTSGLGQPTFSSQKKGTSRTPTSFHCGTCGSYFTNKQYAGWHTRKACNIGSSAHDQASTITVDGHTSPSNQTMAQSNSSGVATKRGRENDECGGANKKAKQGLQLIAVPVPALKGRVQPSIFQPTAITHSF